MYRSFKKVIARILVFLMVFGLLPSSFAGIAYAAQGTFEDVTKSTIEVFENDVVRGSFTSGYNVYKDSNNDQMHGVILKFPTDLERPEKLIIEVDVTELYGTGTQGDGVLQISYYNPEIGGYSDLAVNNQAQNYLSETLVQRSWGIPQTVKLWVEDERVDKFMSAIQNGSEFLITFEGDSIRTAHAKISSIAFKPQYAKLSSLALSAGTLEPAFSKDTYSYTVNVDNSVDSVTITPTHVDPNGWVKIAGNWGDNGQPSAPVALSVGTNTVKVTAVSPDENFYKDYTLTINREAGQDVPINLTAIQGVTTPEIGRSPVSDITETDQYTGEVTWSPDDNHFNADTVYTVTITLTPKTGYTLTGVDANSFTVAGATSVTNDADSGVITAVFPETSYFTFNPTTQTITGYSDDGPKNVVIPATIGGVTVKRIGDNAFENKNLTSVTIQDGIESIGSAAFRYNDLITVELPESVNSIGSAAFYDNALTSVNIPSEVTNVEGSTFAFNELTSITIPQGVTNIGTSAFGSNKLTSLSIPSSVITIGNAAFAQNKLTTLTLAEGLTSIGDNAFYQNLLTSVTIPDSVTILGMRTFYLNHISSVTIPQTLTNLGSEAFASNWLQTVVFSGEPTAISGSDTFYDNNLTTVTIPNSVTSIGSGTFSGNAVTSVTIGSNVTINHNSTMGNYGTSFRTDYATNNKAAGTYSYDSNTGHWIIQGNGDPTADLSSVTLTHAALTNQFSSNTTDYQVMMNPGYKSYTFTVTPEESGATVSVKQGNTTLEPSGGVYTVNLDFKNQTYDTNATGVNDVVITVTSSGNQTKTYKLRDPYKTIQGDSNLKRMTTEQGRINFSVGKLYLYQEQLAIPYLAQRYNNWNFDGAFDVSVPKSFNETNTFNLDLILPDGVNSYSVQKYGYYDGDYYSDGQPINYNTGESLPVGLAYDEEYEELAGGQYVVSFTNGANTYKYLVLVNQDDMTNSIANFNSLSISTTELPAMVMEKPANGTAFAHFICTGTSYSDLYSSCRIPATWTISGVSTGTTALTGVAIDAATGTLSVGTNAAAGLYKVTAAYNGETAISYFLITDNNTFGMISAVYPAGTITLSDGATGTPTVYDNSVFFVNNLEKGVETFKVNIFAPGYENFIGTVDKTESKYLFAQLEELDVQASSNADLASLTLSDGAALTPAFNKDTTSYSVNVSNSVSSISITPTADDPQGAVGLRVNGEIYEGNSGEAFGPFNLNVGNNTIVVTVTAPDTTQKTYTITVTRASGSGSNNDSGHNSGGTTTTPSSGNTGAEILVNGKPENAGTATDSKQGDQTVTTITVDQAKLDQKLQAEGNNAVVTIPVNTNADIVVGELNGQMVKNMEDKEAVLEVKTPSVTYVLPANQINIDAISEQLGKEVALKDIKVQITIAKSDAETIKIVENSAKQGEFTVIAPPVDFTIKCTDGTKTIDVSKFNAYVERMVLIPDGVDPNKITTGVVIDTDGTVRHVPTRVTVIDGRYYAVINSLTNSTYSLVWHPLEFKDAANHWAKDAINDMGSRMVISGVGNDMFEPDRDITRAEFAAIIVRALGLKPGTGNNPFSDVSSSAWYCEYIQTASEYGIISGYGNGKFGPMDKITREQAITMIARAMKITGLKAELKTGDVDSLLAAFGDSEKAASWAKENIAVCVKTGIVAGKNGKLLAPKDEITRAEVAVIVRRLLQKSTLI